MKAFGGRLRVVRFPAVGNWLTVAVAISAAVMVWVLAGVPVEVKRVRVSGIRHLSPAQVEKIAGVKPGDAIGRREARDVRNVLKRHPAIAGVSVSSGVTGTLHIRVKERTPVAWLARESCAVAEDGVLLRHIVSRDQSWVVIAGTVADANDLFDPRTIRQAVEGDELMRESGEGEGGAWCRLLGDPESWLWLSKGKRVVFSSPVSENEVTRLHRFQRSCPKAWARARRMDMRFADRVVVKR